MECADYGEVVLERRVRDTLLPNLIFSELRIKDIGNIQGSIVSSVTLEKNMGIRIQPQDIEIPIDDPFRNDLLGRKEPVKVLTHLIGGIKGPCVLAVDAAWGAGKSTFLKIWAQYLRNQFFHVVEFNAWETDFTGNPFLALSDELTHGLDAYTDQPLVGKIADAKKAAKEVLRRAFPGIIRVATAGILDLNPMIEKEAGQVLASYAQERRLDYREARKSLEDFKTRLRDMASTLAESKQGLPLVVVIDELDRCRPSYAIELLEVAKHLFTVDHIVFVLAVNRSELMHSIRAVYGSGFDAQGYLRRFFDIDFRLPESERKLFIETTLEAIQINDYFRRTKDENTKRSGDHETIKKLLLAFFDAHDLSLRSIAQAIHHLGLLFASLRSDKRSFALTAVVALGMRTINLDLYQKFTRGEVEDREVVDFLFSRPGLKNIRRNHEGVVIEAIIIVAAQEMRHDSYPFENVASSLLTEYRELASGKQLNDDFSDGDHARHVLATVNNFSHPGLSNRGVGFKYAVRRLELFDTDLIDESPTRS